MDHPIVRQTIEDCLTEAMDVDGFLEVLRGLRDGTHRAARGRHRRAVGLRARHPRRAQPYTLPRRRAARGAPHAGRDVAPRRSTSRTADELGALDPDAVARVREEAWPAARRTPRRCTRRCSGWATSRTTEARPLAAVARRAARGRPRRPRRRPLVRGRGHARPEGRAARPAGGARARVRRVRLRRRAAAAAARGRGRRPARAHRRPAGLVRPAPARAHPPLHARPAAPRDRARHRRRSSCASSPAGSTSTPSTGSRARAAWPRSSRQLAGFEVPAAAWEASVLPARVRGYQREWLDQLTLSGRGRLGPALGRGRRLRPAHADRLVPREDLDTWAALAVRGPARRGRAPPPRTCCAALRARGAMFSQELAQSARLPLATVEEGLGGARRARPRHLRLVRRAARGC